MIFDKLSLFADGTTVPTTANANTYSKVIDLRKNQNIEIDGGLKIYGQVVGAANATGSITTVVQTSADGASWTDLASQTQDGHRLIGMFLPFGLKRFIRLRFAVGNTALGSAVVVKAGLVDQFDQGDFPSVQSFPPLEDLATDDLATDLAVSATAVTITKGSSGTVAVNAGKVTAIEAPSKYTVTVSGSTVTIALAADAANGTVVLVGGTGNKVSIAVTAQAAG
jgi:hypothetical protein